MIVNIYNINFKEISIKNRGHNYYFNYLIKGKKLETKNILIDEKVRMIRNIILLDIGIWTLEFGILDCGKSIRMFSLYYHKGLGNIEEHKGKKIFDG